MITSLEIVRREPLTGGAQFGAVGAYVKVSGVARGALDPSHPSNAAIVDLDKAPRNAAGLVEYAGDFVALHPADATKGAGALLYAATNRGNKQLFGQIAEATAEASDLESVADLGDALPLRHGFTILWNGWDGKAPKRGAGQLGFTAPIATNNGAPITAETREEFVAGARNASGDAFALSYEAANLDQTRARLIVRKRRDDPPRELPVSAWRFVDGWTVKLSPEDVKPESGSLYEFFYVAKNPAVLGVGFAATRDLVSYLRHDPRGREAIGGAVTRTLGIGFSQGGRYLLDLVAQGFNADERGRRVFDGILAHAAGAGRVFMNERFAQPFRTRTHWQDHDFPEAVFPFSSAKIADPISGKSAGILPGDGSDPCLIHTNTSSEYWQKGASLTHTDPLGARDLDLPSNARVYLLAGTQHGGRAGIKVDRGQCANLRNPHNPMPIVRALLLALDAWVATGRAPLPPSNVPTVAGASLIEAQKLAFPNLPGVAVPRDANDVEMLADWVNRKSRAKGYRPLVCKVDADGNEIGGVRTPDLLAPLGTHTGWNIFREPYPAGELGDRDGSFIPFSATAEERAQSGDPRPSIAERYGSGAEYVKRVEAAVAALQKDGLLLQEDAERYLAAARTRAQNFPQLFGKATVKNAAE